MVLLALWAQTEKEKYELAAERVWRYEDTLYDKSTNNWKDLRYEGKGVTDGDSVSWCHGAAGILLSRIECCRIIENPEWRKRLREDCIRAYNKLEQYWKRDSWCLCHGVLGNIWILKYGAEFLGKELSINIDYDIKLLPQESLNPGILNGYGGILYYLLCEGKEKHPDILGIFE